MKETINNSFTITIALRRAAGDTNFAHVEDAFLALKNLLEASYAEDVAVTLSTPAASPAATAEPVEDV